jgi:hypothetical protein
MPLRYLFYLKKDIDISNVVVQDSEVDSVYFMSVDEIKELIDNNLMLKSHGILFNELCKRVK